MGSAGGRHGGYSVLKKPADISIPDLLRTIDGPIAPLPCLSRSAYHRCDDCTDEATCRIRKVFAEVFWSYLVIIESLTLEDMLRFYGYVRSGAVLQGDYLEHYRGERGRRGNKLPRGLQRVDAISAEIQD